MSENWKPGDVAVIDGEFYLRTRDGWLFASTSGSTWSHAEGPSAERVTSLARRLVVIDPEDREQVERLAKAMHESDHIAPWHGLHNETRSMIEDAMQAALHEFANPTPPKPDEPKGLGAVVEDIEGNRWVLTERQGGPWWWVRPGVSTPHWYSIAAVRVLSEGVTE